MAYLTSKLKFWLEKRTWIRREGEWMGPFNTTPHLHKLVKLLPSCPPALADLPEGSIWSLGASWNLSVPSDTWAQPKERGRNTQWSRKSDVSLPLGQRRLLWKHECQLWAEVLSWPELASRLTPLRLLPSFSGSGTGSEKRSGAREFMWNPIPSLQTPLLAHCCHYRSHSFQWGGKHHG